MHWTRNIAASSFALLLGACTLAASGQTVPANPSSALSRVSLEDWWKNAVIYEIYPRSFQDSNGDGIGDLNGITARLDYLKSLGVDAIWLTPIFPSPQVDFGYDVSDYEAIDPQYGTMADFDHLLAEANKRHIRVLLDMVMNHTSDQHKWFLESRSSRTNPYRDWYVWRDGKGQTTTSKGEPPSNWESLFGHSAWQWDEKTRQYYYHRFYVQQPDLNWSNPKVRRAFEDVLSFWLKKGVGGFRFDAVGELFEDPNLADQKVIRDANGNVVLNKYGDPELGGSEGSYDTDTPLHNVLREMRATVDKFDSDKFPGKRAMVAEVWMPTAQALSKYYGTPDKPEFELPMDGLVGFDNKFSVPSYRAQLEDAELRLNGNVPLLVFTNHDSWRFDLAFGDGVHDSEIQRVVATVLFATRGASLFYYGDEIAMKTTFPTRKEDVKDPIGITGWPKEKGRDGERTPMQWNAEKNAGFSTGKPWLPVPPNYTTISVQAEEHKSDSMLAWYRQLIELKKTDVALAQGNETMLNTDNTKVLSWLRQAPSGEQVVVATNFTAEPQTVNLSAGVKSTHAKTLLKSPGASDPASLSEISLPPYGVYIGEVQ
jgi:alpha-glucosidase